FASTGGKNGETFLDLLIRYGMKFQQDKNTATNSLFGMDMVEVVRPLPPKGVEKWGSIERLNKERELVGIYLSAHPLDDYEIVLNHTCNTKMTDLENKEDLSKLDKVTFGGIVTGVRNGITKNNKPFAIITMEDYSGSGELPLFGQDYLEYAHQFVVGTSLYITAKIVPGKYDATRFNFQFNKISLMEDIKNSIIENICINIPVETLTETIVTDIVAEAEDSPGQTKLCFCIISPDNTSIDMYSTNYSVTVTKQFINVLERDNLTYTINK
ncbi:MAG: DNA polymerase III subunit alpha, partial [Bacteroidaceae bacterium]|nr:DNA polymerase III subunit alpha [Bacteroidaceae bacterium]